MNHQCNNLDSGSVGYVTVVSLASPFNWQICHIPGNLYMYANFSFDYGIELL